MGNPVQNVHISCRSYDLYTRHMQFLVVIGHLKKSSLKSLAKLIDICWNHLWKVLY